jgi:hypothetical protein
MHISVTSQSNAAFQYNAHFDRLVTYAHVALSSCIFLTAGTHIEVNSLRAKRIFKSLLEREGTNRLHWSASFLKT